MKPASQKEVSVKAKPVNTGDTNNQQSTGSYDPAVASLRDVTDLYPCLLWMCGSAAACMIVRVQVYFFQSGHTQYLLCRQESSQSIKSLEMVSLVKTCILKIYM